MVYVKHEKSMRVPLTWESLIWFMVFTTIGTAAGAWLYAQYIEPYLQTKGVLPSGDPANATNPLE
jgi:hypothetical protein